MQNPVIVRVLQGGGDLFEQQTCLGWSERTTCTQAVGERAMADIGHDQVVPGAFLAIIIHRQNMLMSQRRECCCLALEASEIVSLPAMHDFDRYIAVKIFVVREVNISHATLPDAPLQLIAPQGFSYQCLLHKKK